MNEAVIFDMDGVLIDSYHAHMASWVEVAREAGIHIHDRDFASQFGRTSREIIETYWGTGTLSDEQIRSIDDRKEAIFRKLIEHQLPMMSGAVELIQELKNAGFKVAIGSSGPPENVNLAIDGLGVRAILDAVVTGRDVRRGKPDPEVFQLAAKRMKMPVEVCVVVEDAPPGIQAARGAGMKCVTLLSTGRKREDFVVNVPDLFVQKLSELRPEVFRDLLSNAGSRF